MSAAETRSPAGPGPITADGCPVDLYARLPVMGEPGIVHAAVRPGASILDLGCGTGRVARGLIALGHEVVAVDESAEMLAHVTGARTVCTSIASLDLGRRFGAGLGFDEWLTEDHGWFAARPQPRRAEAMLARSDG